jgi:hypothetical protein
MFMIPMHNSSGSLVITMKRKAKYMFNSASMLLFYILHNYHNKKFIHFEYLLHAAFQDSARSGINVAFSSEIRTTTMLVL